MADSGQTAQAPFPDTITKQPFRLLHPPQKAFEGPRA